jgi:hypothetical protein
MNTASNIITDLSPLVFEIYLLTIYEEPVSNGLVGRELGNLLNNPMGGAIHGIRCSICRPGPVEPEVKMKEYL